MISRLTSVAALAAKTFASAVAGAQAAPLTYQLVVTTDIGIAVHNGIVGIGAPISVKSGGKSALFTAKVGLTGGGYSLSLNRILPPNRCADGAFTIPKVQATVAVDESTTVNVGYEAPAGAPEDFDLQVYPDALGTGQLARLAHASHTAGCGVAASTALTLTADLDQGSRTADVRVPLSNGASDWTVDICTSGRLCTHSDDIDGPTGSFAFRSYQDGSLLTPVTINLDDPGQLRFTNFTASKLDAVYDLNGAITTPRKVYLDTDRALVSGRIDLLSSDANIDATPGFWAENRYLKVDFDYNPGDPFDFDDSGLIHCFGLHIGLHGVPGFIENYLVDRLCNT